MKRVFLFVMTNLAVLVTLSIVAHLFGFNRYFDQQGINFGALLGFAAVFGFGGAFISLAMSKWTAKRGTGARVIDQPRTATESWLVDTVRRQAQAVGIAMPEVAIFPSPEVNAFATGPSRNKSLVAVSAGLLEKMTRDEAEAVVAHEVAHVANGDMVTLTLIQGVLNTFVLFMSRVIGNVIDRVILKNENGPGIGYFVSTIILDILFGILVSFIVMWFSRQREYRADAGGAKIAGRDKMVAALRRLQAQQDESYMPAKMTAFGISGKGKSGVARLMSSHPSLDDRIARLMGTY